MFPLFANSGDPDQTLHSVASDQGLHCLPTALLGASGLHGLKRKPSVGKRTNASHMNSS